MSSLISLDFMYFKYFFPLRTPAMFSSWYLASHLAQKKELIYSLLRPSEK